MKQRKQRSHQGFLALVMAVMFAVSNVTPMVTPAGASGLKAITSFSGGNGDGHTQDETIYFGSYWQSGNVQKMQQEIDAGLLQNEVVVGTKTFKVLDNGNVTATTGEALTAQGKDPVEYFNKEGIKWRVLSNEGEEVLLLSDKALYADAFNEDSDKGTSWGTSEVRDTLNNSISGSGFAGDAFDANELGAIKVTDVMMDGTVVSQDKLFLLSNEDVNNKYGFDQIAEYVPSTKRKAAYSHFAQNVKVYNNPNTVSKTNSDSNWWLRSNLDEESYSYYVAYKGWVDFASIDSTSNAVRPAFNLDSSQVLFLSATVGGKKDVDVNGGFKLQDVDPTAADFVGWKPTLKDAYSASNPTGIKTPTIGGGALTLDANGSSTWKYSGASTGVNMYVSAVLKNNADSTQGNYINYAKLANATSASGTMTIGSNGTSTLTGDYYMFIFGEEANDNYLTDYASDFNAAIPVTFTGGKLIGMTLDDNFTDASNAVTLKNGFTLTLADNTTYDQSFTSAEGNNTLVGGATSGTTLAGNINVTSGATLTLRGKNTIDGTLTGAPITIAGPTTIGANGSITSSGLNFNLDGHNPGDVFITVADSASPINLSGKTIGLIQTDPDYKLSKGEKMTLITKAQNYNGEEEVETTKGVKKYLYSVELDNGALLLGCIDTAAADQTKSFNEARLGVSAALNSASDLVASAVMENAKPKGKEWETFVTLGGSHSRYETGSHVDLNMFNVAAGLSKVVFDNLTLGVFAEGGNGRYNTENNFAEGLVTASGDINYFGGGLFAKVEGKKTELGQLHAEASFRAGYINSKYSSDNFAPGTNTSFNMGSPYLGAHAGFGYKWALGKDSKSNIDTYVKYLWNRQNSDRVTVDSENIDFDAINSHRLRVGFRYNGKEDKNGFNFFGGLAYEYEFDGKAKGHMGDFALLEPDFKGGSGMAELGFKYEKDQSPWKAEIALQGFTGKRDSIGANLSVWYMFGK